MPHMSPRHLVLLLLVLALLVISSAWGGPLLLGA